MTRWTLATALLVVTAHTAKAQQPQQVIAPGDSVRWTETTAALGRKGTGRVLTLEPAAIRVLHRTDTINVEYANLKNLQLYKKRPIMRVFLISASLAAAGVLVAMSEQRETLCDGTRCVESTLQGTRVGSPVVYGTVGAVGGLGLGLFFHKVKPGPWQTVIKR